MHKGKWSLLLTAILAAGMLGCHDDKPHEYGKERPPVDEIDEGGRGLQSKDVVEASDKMAMDLLADPALNASKTQWTVVVGGVENHTSDPRANLDIFLRRLGVSLGKQGSGRVQLIENRDRFHGLQSKELEQPGPGDEYGQGSGGQAPPGPAGIQPDYELIAVMSDMPNRHSDYYYCDFTLVNLHNRLKVWTGSYEVKVKR